MLVVVKAWNFIENRDLRSQKLKAESITGSFTVIYNELRKRYQKRILSHWV